MKTTKEIQILACTLRNGTEKLPDTVSADYIRDSVKTNDTEYVSISRQELGG